jgi:hypothetical protein
VPTMGAGGMAGGSNDDSAAPQDGDVDATRDGQGNRDVGSDRDVRRDAAIDGSNIGDDPCPIKQRRPTRPRRRSSSNREVRAHETIS